MNPADSMDLVDRLEARFDDESVQLALRKIEASALTASEAWLMGALLKGRGAKNLWPRLEQRLKSDLSLANVGRLGDYLPRAEVAKLRDQVAVDEDRIVADICAGKYPMTRVLPKEHRQKIYERLRRLVETDTNIDASIILGYLLSFDRETRIGPASRESQRLATDWCLQFADDKKIESVLSSLLRMNRSPELLRIAEKHISNCEWNLETTLLLTSLMAATGTRQNPNWAKDWLERSQLFEHDGWVVSNWISSSNCSRESLSVGKEALRSGWTGRWDVLRTLCRFWHRKPVRRWMQRFLEQPENAELVANNIFYIFDFKSSRQKCAIAKNALDVVDANHRLKILLELTRRTNKIQK